jgi:hypothetical protein
MMARIRLPSAHPRQLLDPVRAVVACGVLAIAVWLVVGLGGQDPDGRVVRDVDGAPVSAIVVFDDWAPFTRSADEPTGPPASGSAQLYGTSIGVRPGTRAQSAGQARPATGTRGQASRTPRPGGGAPTRPAATPPAASRPGPTSQASSNAAPQASLPTPPGKGPSNSQRPANASGGNSGNGTGNDSSGSKSPAKRG